MKKYGQSMNESFEVFNQTKSLMELNLTFEGLDYGPLLSGPESTDTTNDMPWWVRFLWTTVFSLMIVTAACGNCIVIWIVVAHRRMRTVTNYFLVNLSTADLLLTTLNSTFNFIYMIQRNWPFGSWYCTVSNFIANATVAASVFTLTGISCDRYLAIVHPLQPRMSKTCAIVTIIFIWIASMVFASPCLIYSATITNRYRGKVQTGCILIWPDGKVVGSEFDFAYQMLFLVLTYLVPISLMTLCYSLMGRVLWGSKSIGEMTQRQIDSIRSKRKVVKMFILIVFIFGICWLPYHSYFLYVYYDPNIIFKKYTQHIYLCFYWFAMSNAMVNPLIYYWMNARFRTYFRTAMCGWQDMCSKKTHSDSTLSRQMLDKEPYQKSVRSEPERVRGSLLVNHACHNDINLTKKASRMELAQLTADRDRKKKRKMWLQDSFRRQSIQTTVNL